MSTSIPTLPARPASLDGVLAYAWTCEEFTATEAMEATGLTRSTTIDAMDALARLGLLRELPNARQAGDYRKGRPARRFALRDDAAVLVGVDAGQTHVSATVTDLRSRPLTTRRATLGAEHDEGTRRAALALELVDEALSAAGRARSDVLAICAGVAAPVNAEGRSPRHPTGFWERMNPGLIDALAWAPIARVENDASLAAVAEGAFGSAVGCRNYIALLAGARLGAGVVVDGNLLHGAHGGVGEMVAFEHVDGVGTADGLGARAASWAADVVAHGTAAEGSALAAIPLNHLDGRAVLELAAQGDDDAHRIVERMGSVLARIVSVLGSMFDPQRVVVSGAISAGVNEVVTAAGQALPTDLDLPAPELVVSSLGADIVVTGAIAAAAADARERVLDVWMTDLGT
ncbi:Sugar kinase of the NBD/HSP70 family, may contain an N-terminal HTH domain [Paramicrobacterium humi]|uniref:Sugar kinase of the NBD/HSP70 family, may contain an N-terminal HTH domain n=1 Tax=Paramicrobacterium humi TaxID=640635 RepID=A0A1H4M5N5_9MICO|nr:ROK family protein [Microbacterium humi]SEB78339.1 Sugar kinase of the NBD/HSP70 family, may contain an N-terminal HTH domain [Microbacterium humi]